MKLTIHVEDEQTQNPIDGATVAAYVTDAGPSDTEVEQIETTDPKADDMTATAEIKTQSNQLYQGAAIFDIAKWVTETKIVVSHDRFHQVEITVHPSTDEERTIVLTPQLGDITVGLTEYYPEPATVRIRPVDPVVEAVYGDPAEITLTPGESEEFSFIIGRYRFELEDPVEPYTGETKIIQSLKSDTPSRIEFSGMEQTAIEQQQSPDSQNVPEDETEGEDKQDNGGIVPNSIPNTVAGVFSDDDDTEATDQTPEDPAQEIDTDSDPGAIAESTEDPDVSPAEEVISSTTESPSNSAGSPSADSHTVDEGGSNTEAEAATEMGAESESEGDAGEEEMGEDVTATDLESGSEPESSSSGSEAEVESSD